MPTTSLADAKNRLSEIIQSAQDTHERFVITKNGRPAVVLIAVDDLESLEETLDILSDHQLLALVDLVADATLPTARRWSGADLIGGGDREGHQDRAPGRRVPLTTDPGCRLSASVSL